MVQFGVGTWGVIGFNRLKIHPDFELVGVCDPVPYPKKLNGIRQFEILKDIDIDFDAAYLAIPIEDHLSTTKNLLEAGKHCLVEKPLVTNLIDVAEINKLAIDKKLVVAGGLLLLYHPHIQEIRNIIDRGDIGRVTSVVAERYNLGIHRRAGILWELAPHDLSIVNSILGPFVPRGGWKAQVGGMGVDDLAGVWGYVRDILVNVTWSWVSPIKSRRTLITGTENMLLWDAMLPEPFFLIRKKIEGYGKYKEGISTVIPSPDGNALDLEFTAFGNAIRAGRSGIVDDSKLIVRQIEDIYKLVQSNESLR